MRRSLPTSKPFVKGHFDKVKESMPFTLITAKGKVMSFYVHGTATLYQNLYGGTIFTEAILNTEEETITQ